MRIVRLALLAACAATLLSGSALAQGSGSPAAPTSLKPFLLRANEPARHDFARTPSFSWQPVRGATRYEFQLSKTPIFQQGTIFWASSSLTSPAVAIPLTLPWMTGSPYAAYARVRAVTHKGTTAWSSSYGFNVRWQDVPKFVASYPGLATWTPVEGATSYQVWFTDINRVAETRVNSMDEREFYAFHQGAGNTGTVNWRVRAVRRVGKLQGFITPVNFGPWSQKYSSVNPAMDAGVVHPVASLTAMATSTLNARKAHEMTPAFVFSGSTDATGKPYGLYRVYVFSDRECVNTVFRGAIVGSPAYAARNKGTLKLPTDAKDVDAASSTILDVGDEGTSFTAEGLKSKPASEQGSAAADPGAATTPDPSASGTTPPGNTVEQATNSAWPQIELLESGWPNGQYYWTVVPVGLVPKVGSDGKITSYSYHDAEQPQDNCASGRVLAFGKASPPVVAGSGTAFASGLSPKGRLTAAAGSKPFYGSPLVAWQPVPGADTYEIEWSPTHYPWRAVRRIPVDGGTAAMLPLKSGKWWYRIRGVNSALPDGHQAMAWSKPLQLTMAKPVFHILGGSSTTNTSSKAGARSFTMDLPAGWKRSSRNGVYAEAGVGTASFALMTVSWYTGEKATDEAELLAEAKEAAKKAGMTTDSISWVTLAAGRAIRVVGRLTVQGTTVKELLLVFAPTGGKGPVLTFVSSVAAFDDRLADFEKMAKSFRYT